MSSGGISGNDSSQLGSNDYSKMVSYSDENQLHDLGLDSRMDDRKKVDLASRARLAIDLSAKAAKFVASAKSSIVDLPLSSCGMLFSAEDFRIRCRNLSDKFQKLQSLQKEIQDPSVDNRHRRRLEKEYKRIDSDLKLELAQVVTKGTNISLMVGTILAGPAPTALKIGMTLLDQGLNYASHQKNLMKVSNGVKSHFVEGRILDGAANIKEKKEALDQKITSNRAQVSDYEEAKKEICDSLHKILYGETSEERIKAQGAIRREVRTMKRKTNLANDVIRTRKHNLEKRQKEKETGYKTLVLQYTDPHIYLKAKLREELESAERASLDHGGSPMHAKQKQQDIAEAFLEKHGTVINTPLSDKYASGFTHLKQLLSDIEGISVESPRQKSRFLRLVNEAQEAVGKVEKEVHRTSSKPTRIIRKIASVPKKITDISNKVVAFSGLLTRSVKSLWNSSSKFWN